MPEWRLSSDGLEKVPCGRERLKRNPFELHCSPGNKSQKPILHAGHSAEARNGTKKKAKLCGS